MASEFSRILTLLRKEKGISQKSAAASLGISQGLLSHYEKGIRECGLDFLVRAADFYGVSCDYLLGRTADRTGTVLSDSEYPGCEKPNREPEDGDSQTVRRMLRKKTVVNSLNILFDLLKRRGNPLLEQEVGDFLLLSVYRMFRAVCKPPVGSQAPVFRVPEQLAQPYSNAAMEIHCANAISLAQEKTADGTETGGCPSDMPLSAEALLQAYPCSGAALIALISSSEGMIAPSSDCGIKK